MFSLFFFFSSRRRHTRYWRDWSSDVCSSDLFLITASTDLHIGRTENPDQEPFWPTGNFTSGGYRGRHLPFQRALAAHSPLVAPAHRPKQVSVNAGAVGRTAAVARGGRPPPRSMSVIREHLYQG